MFFRRTIDRLPEQPKKIVLIRFGSESEVLRGLPLLVALRLRYPFAEITWLADERGVAVLKGHRALNRILVVPKNWNRSWEGIRYLRSRLSRIQPEMTLDLHGSFQSILAAWISGAKYRIGFAKSGHTHHGNFLNNIRVTPNEEHEIDRLLQLLEPLGVHGCSVAFDLSENETDKTRVAEKLGWIGLNHHFAILGPGTDSSSPAHRLERYAGLAKYLFEQWNLPSLVLWSGANEKSIAEAVVESAREAAILCPPVSSSELASMIRRATIVVGPECPALEISAAVGTRCIGLFGATSPSRFGPYDRQNRSIQAIQQHGSKTQNPMDAIETDAVCDVCDTILAEILDPVRESTLEFRKPTVVVTPKSLPKAA